MILSSTGIGLTTEQLKFLAPLRLKVWSAEPMVLLICQSPPAARLLAFTLNHYSFNYYSVILIFLLEKLGIKYYPVTKPEFQLPLRSPDFFKTLLFLAFLFNHYEFFTREARDIVPPCNTARIWVVYFKNNYNWMDCQILQRSVFFCWQVSLFI